MTITGGTVTLAGAALTSTTMAVSRMPNPSEAVLWAAAFVTALGVLYKGLHIGQARKTAKSLGKLAEREEALGVFLADWTGTAARPGFDAQPGFPDRLAQMERHMHEVKGAMPSLAQALTDLATTTTDNGDKIDKLDQRVTDHRRRNDQQAEVLRADLERRAVDLERKLESRNHDVDEKLTHLSEDLLRAQTWRAALHELGYQVEGGKEPEL